MSSINVDANLDGLFLKSRFQTVKTTNVQTITSTTFVVLTWDANQYIDSDYSHTVTSSDITINADGNYKLSFNVSLSNQQSARRVIVAAIRVNAVIEDATRTYCYVRNTTQDEGTCSLVQYEITLSDGDVITVAAADTLGTTDVDTLLVGTFLRIERVEED